MDDFDYSLDVFEEIMEEEQLLKEERERLKEEQRLQTEREMEEQRLSADETSYRSTIETLQYEIRKNKRNIEEWHSLIGDQPSRSTEFGALVEDAHKRIRNWEQRISELEEQENSYRSEQPSADGY